MISGAGDVRTDRNLPLLMIDNDSGTNGQRSHLALMAIYVGSLITLWLGLRLVLFAAFHPMPAPAWTTIGYVFLIGAWRDLFVALLFAFPWLLWFFLVPEHWFASRWHCPLVGTLLFLSWIGYVF